jgi:hypothetical protein
MERLDGCEKGDRMVTLQDVASAGIDKAISKHTSKRDQATIPPDSRLGASLRCVLPTSQSHAVPQCGEHAAQRDDSQYRDVSGAGNEQIESGHQQPLDVDVNNEWLAEEAPIGEVNDFDELDWDWEEDQDESQRQVRCSALLLYSTHSS